MINILIVEEDNQVADLIAMNLSLVGYDYKKVYTGKGIIREIEKNDYDLILLNIQLPEINGFDVFDEIKKYKIPVIFLTTRASLADKVKGLKMGAEDFIMKPFEALELLARIEVVLRRFKKESNTIILGNVIIDTDRHLVKGDNVKIDLTNKEYDLLLFLAKNRNKAISREALIEEVWGVNFNGEVRTVDIHIQRLRKKIGSYINISTVYKYGYRLDNNE